MSSEQGLNALPRRVEDINDCFFYHTMDLPDHGVVKGQWDLRGHVDEYLGHMDFKDKRVLEVGTASGFLCFEMEKRGAEVVGYDLGEDNDWDIVPLGGQVPPSFGPRKKQNIRRLNNGWWLAHRLLNSRAKVVYGSVYAIPEAIGPVDVVTFGSILLHLRDPFLALQRGCALAEEAAIVTDMMPSGEWGAANPAKRWAKRVFMKIVRHNLAYLIFLPDSRNPGACDTWWNISPAAICRYLEVLGFPRTEVSFHKQTCVLSGRQEDMYTVVARR